MPIARSCSESKLRGRFAQLNSGYKYFPLLSALSRSRLFLVSNSSIFLYFPRSLRFQTQLDRTVTARNNIYTVFRSQHERLNQPSIANVKSHFPNRQRRSTPNNRSKHECSRSKPNRTLCPARSAEMNRRSATENSHSPNDRNRSALNTYKRESLR